MGDLRWTCPDCGTYIEGNADGFSAEVLSRLVAQHQAERCPPAWFEQAAQLAAARVAELPAWARLSDEQMRAMTAGRNPAEACHWCGRTGYGRECPPCEVKHEGEPLPSEDGANHG